MEYKCNICNKQYKSYQSLWNHNHIKHNTKMSNTSSKTVIHTPKITPPNKTNKKIYECIYCKNIFSRSDNLKRHHIICSQKSDYESLKASEKETENNILLDQLKILTQKIEQLEKNINKPQTINNFNGPINNGPINNTINICNIGEENIKLLTKEEREYILSKEVNGIVAIVDKLNFNTRLPQYHIFYTSALNGKYTNTIDKETNTIIKRSKKDFFDTILVSSMKKLEQLSKEDKRFIPAYERLQKFIYDKKTKKEFHEQINELSFNKQKMVMETLNKMVTDYSINQDDIPIKLDNEIKQIADIPENECTTEQIDDFISDFDTSSDSDSDSESDGRILKATKVQKHFDL